MVITVAIGDPTSEANTYIVGMAIRLTVPVTYGMIQANNLVGTIIAISGSNFSLNIDSSLFDAFIVPITIQPGYTTTPASIAPYGSKNLDFNNTTARIIPFHSLNNVGN